MIIRHENGEWKIRLDLSYPHLKLVIEYDGWHHRLDERQWSATSSAENGSKAEAGASS